MYGRESLNDGLLQYPQGDVDILEILCTRINCDVDGLETTVVIDGHLDEWYLDIVAWVVDLLFQSPNVVQNEHLLYIIITRSPGFTVYITWLPIANNAPATTPKVVMPFISQL